MRFLPKSRLKQALLALAALLAACALLAFFFPQQVLCVDSGGVQGDALVVLGGGSGERPARAAELFRSGAASKIIVSGRGDSASNRQKLLAAGVPVSAVQIEPKSVSTRQNAQFSIALLRELGARRVIIVTTWYHSRRALRAFEHYAPDLKLYSCPSYYGYPRSQWSRVGLRGCIRAEFAKLAGYWLCYGICPY